MKFHINGSKILEYFVFLGCSAMFMLQIIISINDYFSYKTVATLHVKTLEEIVFPHIVICYEKSYRNADLKELLSGIKETEEGGKDGWGEKLGMKPFEYLSSVAYQSYLA